MSWLRSIWCKHQWKIVEKTRHDYKTRLEGSWDDVPEYYMTAILSCKKCGKLVVKKY